MYNPTILFGYLKWYSPLSDVVVGFRVVLVVFGLPVVDGVVPVVVGDVVEVVTDVVVFSVVELLDVVIVGLVVTVDSVVVVPK